VESANRMPSAYVATRNWPTMSNDWSVVSISRPISVARPVSISRTAVIGVSIVAVIPGACTDEYTVHEIARAVKTIGCASVRIVRIIAVGANWRSSDGYSNGSNADPDANANLSRCAGCN
jgi:hypothetical protein